MTSPKPQTSLSDFGGRLIGFSIIVTGEYHNPSILTPTFLRHNNIVPDADGYQKPDDILVSSQFSNLQYGNLAIQADRQRISFHEKRDSQKLQSPEIVRQYLRHVPHVRYTGIGINPTLFIDSTQGNGREMILQSLVKKGAWLLHEGVSSNAELKCTFDWEKNRRVSFSITAGNVRVSEHESVENVLVFHEGNLHFDISSEAGSSDIAMNILGDVDKHLGDYYNLIRKIVEDMNRG